jgi:hypothetical protein
MMQTTSVLLVIISVLAIVMLWWGIARSKVPSIEPERRGPGALPNVEIGEILLLTGMQGSGKTKLAERIGAKYYGFCSVPQRANDQQLTSMLMRYGNPEVVIFDDCTLSSYTFERLKQWATSGKRVIVCTQDVTIAERVVRLPSNRRVKHIHLARDGEQVTAAQTPDEPTAKLQARSTTIVSERTTFGPNDETPMLRDYQQISPAQLAALKGSVAMPRGAGKHLPESGD